MQDNAICSTGLDGLDKLLGGGLRPGSLTYLAGRPGMGCSCLLRQMQSFGDDLVTVDTEQRLLEGQTVHFPRIGEAAAELRSLAAALGVPVLCAGKLPRSLEQRKEKRPALADFVQGHGEAAAEKADVILLLYRAAYYRDESGRQGGDAAELIVVKNRFGPTGTVPLHWSRETEWAPLLFWEDER